MNNRAEKYSAGLMSEAPWFHEFKKMIYLIHEGKSLDEIKTLCVKENLFGMPKEYRALRTYSYLLNRVNVMDEQLIDLFCSSDLATQKLINFITIILGDRLLYELINEVYKEKVFLGYSELSVSDINVFFTDKCTQDEEMKEWKDTTFKRLRSGYLQFMTDANLLQKGRGVYYVTPPILDISLERYLQYSGKEHILKAITGGR